MSGPVCTPTPQLAVLEGTNQDSVGTSQALGRQAGIDGGSLAVSSALAELHPRAHIWALGTVARGQRAPRLGRGQGCVPQAELGYEPRDLASESELVLNPNCVCVLNR